MRVIVDRLSKTYHDRSGQDLAALEEKADALARYLMFADEAPLPLPSPRTVRA